MTTFDFTSTVEDTKWTVSGIIPQGHLGVMLAQAGVGKSLILEALAVHIVYEIPFCGFETKFGDVLIIDQDTPTNVLNKRLLKFGKALGQEPVHKLYVESMKGYSMSDGTLFTAIKDHGSCVLIIIDSLHSVCGQFNPNSTGDMSKLAKLKNDCLTPYKTILINHHITEKIPYTIDQLMNENSHNMAMGNSAIIQQADTYYIVGATADNGYTNKLYVRPIAKRASIRSIPLILSLLQPTEDTEKIEFLQDYILGLEEAEMDCLTLFQQHPLELTVKETYEAMGHKHGENAIRKALTSLVNKGKVTMSRHKSNLFKFKAV